MKHAAIPTPDDASDDELSRYLLSLPPCPGIPVTDEEVEAMERRSRADIVAGRVYSHAIVSEWLETWGKPGRQSFKDWFADRDG